MLRRRRALIGASLLAMLAAMFITQRSLQQVALAQASDLVPIYEVDPTWPKTPLPNKWVIGNVIGVAVDSRDNVWITQRPHSLSANEIPLSHTPPTGEDCCMPAPPILAFDQAGNIVRSWGPIVTGKTVAGPDWPDSEHGMFVDYRDNVWVGGGGDGFSKTDRAIFKFSLDGKLLARYGEKGSVYDSNDPKNFGQPADINVDPKTNEIWVADGYRNKRIIVLDANTGAYKRHWGAYGNKPDDATLPYDPAAAPSQQFRNPVHCVLIANDGLVYVCDRGNDRIQVFTKDGKFVKEQFIAKKTLSAGSVWDIGFSVDPQQTYIFLVDGINHKVRILRRSDLQEVSSFGHHGRWAGGFYAAHSLGVDSKQNIYVGETWEGKRLQKFVYKGMGRRPATAAN